MCLLWAALLVLPDQSFFSCIVKLNILPQTIPTLRFNLDVFSYIQVWFFQHLQEGASVGGCLYLYLFDSQLDLCP